MRKSDNLSARHRLLPARRMTPAPPARLVRLLTRAYALLYRTLRIEMVVEDLPVRHLREYRFGPELWALSERDALALAGTLSRARFTVLVAHGRDGDWAATALRELGAVTVRGAYRRGGAAAYARLLQALQEGAGPIGLVVDGPVGPEGIAREGAVACAAATGRALRPVSAAARRSLVFRRSWSRIWLPLPFTRLVIACGAPMPVPERARREEREALTQELTRRIAAARRIALDRIRDPAGGP